MRFTEIENDVTGDLSLEVISELQGDEREKMLSDYVNSDSEVNSDSSEAEDDFNFEKKGS